MSISRYFLILIQIAIISTGIFMFWFGFSVYRNEEEKVIQIMMEESDYAERILRDKIDYAAYIMEYINRQIVENEKYNDQVYIKKLLDSLKLKPSANNLISLSLFTWIDSNDRIVVSNAIINPNSINHLRGRDYIKKAKSKPWQMFIGSPTFGNVSNQWIMPAGMAAREPSGKYVGSITMGFVISALFDELEEKLSRFHYKISLYTHDLKLIPRYHDDFPRDPLKNIKLPEDKEYGVLQKPDMIGPNQEFIFFKKVKKYPFIIVMEYDSKYAKQELFNKIIPRFVEITVPLLVLVTILYLTKKFIIRPISVLANIASNISTDAELPKFPVIQIKEIDILSEQLQKINYYVKTLKFTRDELLKKTNELEKAKNEIQQMNNSLEEIVRVRTNELEKALKIKTDILNHIGHEIKTPLHAVKGIMRELRDRWESFTDQQKYDNTQKAAKYSKRLTYFIESMLDLSKFSSGRMQFVFQKIDIIPIVEEIVEEFQELKFIPNNIHFQYFRQNDNDHIYIYGDASRFTQVLRNILDNALKYSDAKNIRLEIKTTDTNAIITIEDDGIGINAEEIDKIFEPFYQSNRTNKANGSGMGLSICREIVNAHGGSIWAEPNIPKGSRFIFSLPLFDIGKHEQDVVKKDDKVCHILFIDDEQACHDLFDLMTMHSKEIKVYNAYSGYEGLKLLHENPDKFNIIFLDMMMPDVYGLDVLKEIRKNPKFKDIPVIIQSGITEESEINKVMKSGAQGFLSKPYDSRTIFSFIFDFS